MTLKGRGAELGEEETNDHEGWQVCHYDATARGVQNTEINGEITAGRDINTDREGFASHSACPFPEPFSSFFHTPELGRRLKSNNFGNGHNVFLCRSFTPSTSII